MRANRYLHIAVIGATFLFLVLWQTAAAGPPEKPGNPGLPGCLAKVTELNDIVANQQETIDEQAARIQELEDILQNFAPVPKTGQTQIYESGDDGDLQKGVQWPDPRYTDNGDGTVTDHLTGLIWLKNANCFSYRTWDEALGDSSNLANGQCGLSDGSVAGDWRLPNVREILSLTDFSNYLPSGHLFTYEQHNLYWTSTTVSYNSGGAWHWWSGAGHITPNTKDNVYCVWPVRGGN
jgi:hypothetical protein